MSAQAVTSSTTSLSQPAVSSSQLYSNRTDHYSRHHFYSYSTATENPGCILVARPITEFLNHLKNGEMPSFALIARVIKAFVLYIFRGHLCDYVFLVKNEGILHSIIGRLEIISMAELEAAYPKLFKSCYILICDDKTKLNTEKFTAYPYKQYYVGGLTYHRDADLSSLKEITPQSIAEYYLNYYGVQLSNKKKDHTILDLLNSKFLKNETDNLAIKQKFESYHHNFVAATYRK
jgi:hypothetical protein